MNQASVPNPKVHWIFSLNTRSAAIPDLFVLWQFTCSDHQRVSEVFWNQRCILHHPLRFPHFSQAVWQSTLQHVWKLQKPLRTGENNQVIILRINLVKIRSVTTVPVSTSAASRVPWIKFVFDFFKVSTQDQTASCPPVTRSVLLISERNAPHVVGVVRYLGRTNALLPPELLSFGHGIHMAREDLKTNRPLCSYLKSFGVCRSASSNNDKLLYEIF